MHLCSCDGTIKSSSHLIAKCRKKNTQ